MSPEIKIKDDNGKVTEIELSSEQAEIVVTNLVLGAGLNDDPNKTKAANIVAGIAVALITPQVSNNS